MDKLVGVLQKRYPSLSYLSGREFCWSPETQEIIYISNAKGDKAKWSLLHETGHALLGHSGYKSDFELLTLEVNAWERAKLLADELTIIIDEDHIQDCLDTYRDWLHSRSKCPNCHSKSMQQNDLARYHCFNCHAVWQVSDSRFSRAYRQTQKGQAMATVFDQLGAF